MERMWMPEHRHRARLGIGHVQQRFEHSSRPGYLTHNV
jgi:hypothetical protein